MPFIPRLESLGFSGMTYKAYLIIEYRVYPIYTLSWKG
jgi:hypothetical protein